MEQGGASVSCQVCEPTVLFTLPHPRRSTPSNGHLELNGFFAFFLFFNFKNLFPHYRKCLKMSQLTNSSIKGYSHIGITTLSRQEHKECMCM